MRTYYGKEGLELLRLLTMELCYVHVAGSMSALCNTLHEALYMYVVALMWDLWIWLSHGNNS